MHVWVKTRINQRMQTSLSLWSWAMINWSRESDMHIYAYDKFSSIGSYTIRISNDSAKFAPKLVHPFGWDFIYWLTDWQTHRNTHTYTETTTQTNCNESIIFPRFCWGVFDQKIDKANDTWSAKLLRHLLFDTIFSKIVTGM